MARRLSAVEGRHGLAISVGFCETSLVTGRRSLVEGRCEAAEDGLLTAITPGDSFAKILLLPVLPTTVLVAAFGILSG